MHFSPRTASAGKRSRPPPRGLGRLARAGCGAPKKLLLRRFCHRSEKQDLPKSRSERTCQVLPKKYTFIERLSEIETKAFRSFFLHASAFSALHFVRIFSSEKVCFYDRSDAVLKTGYAKKKSSKCVPVRPPVAAVRAGRAGKQKDCFVKFLSMCDNSVKVL